MTYLAGGRQYIALTVQGAGTPRDVPELVALSVPSGRSWGPEVLRS